MYVMTSWLFSFWIALIPTPSPKATPVVSLLAPRKSKPIESPHHTNQPMERQSREDNFLFEQQLAELPQSATTGNAAGPAGENRRLGRRACGSLSPLGRRSSPNRVSEPGHRVRIKAIRIPRIVRTIPSVAGLLSSAACPYTAR